MKAVVVEIKNDLAAVLSDDGCITTVKNNNFEIGQVINIHKSRISIPRKLGMVAASAAAFVILGTGLWAYASPYSYVSIDVNPSVEFNVNRFDRVIQVKAVNDDGEKILKELSLSELKNKTIKQALVNTVNQIDDAGYFNKVKQGSIVIAASCADKEKAESLAVELEQSITEATQENGDTVEVNAFSVDRERIAEAKKLGVTPGKLNLVEKLHEAEGNSSTFDIEEWLKKSVKDIMKAIKDYKNESKEAISATGNDKSMDSQANQEDSSQLNNDTNEGTDKENKKSNYNKTETESDIEHNDTSSSSKSSSTNTNSTKKDTKNSSKSDNENIVHNKNNGDNKKADSNNKDTSNNKNSVSDNNDNGNTKKSNSDSKDTSNTKNSVSDNNDTSNTKKSNSDNKDNSNTKKSNSNNKDTSNNKNSDSDSKDTSNTKKSNSDNKDTSNNKNSVSDSKDTSNTNASTNNGDKVNNKSSSSDNSINADNTSKTGSSEVDNAKENDKSTNSTSNSSSTSDNNNKNNDKPKK